MAWRQIGDKLVPETMLTQFTDSYMQHQEEMELMLSHWNKNSHYKDKKI